MAPYDSIKGGFHRKILRIDLTERKSTIEEIPENLLNDFLGGRGLGAKILYDGDAFRDGLKDIRGLLKKQPGVSPNFTRYGSGEDLESMRSIHGIL